MDLTMRPKSKGEASRDLCGQYRGRRATMSGGASAELQPVTLCGNQKAVDFPDFNKYKVLPAIAKGRSGNVKPLFSKGGVPMTCASGGTLLLAIRAPCGGRFERHFDRADSLRTVKDCAEARFGTWYGSGVAITTMDLPRRSFTDLNFTLAQCCIQDRSVLCITASVN